MQYLFDENGRRYLDAIAGIVTVSCGHCHPDIVKAINTQNEILQHATTIYLHHAIADFAEALASKMSGNLKVVYFVNSGTEANELAIQMVRLYSGSHDMFSLRNPYHGVFGSDGEQYAKDVKDLIDFGSSGCVVGFIAETIQKADSQMTKNCRGSIFDQPIIQPQDYSSPHVRIHQK